MPVQNFRIQQNVKVGGAANLKGHLGQEVRETVDALLSGSSTSAVLVPSRDNASGFRPIQLKDHHKGGGFAIDKERVNDWIAPSPELLAGVGGLRTRRAFVPEMYSDALGRNVRFSVSLPPGFDPAKAASYPIVEVLPDDKTLAAHIGDGLHERVDRELRGRGLEDAIVVVLERLEHRSWVDQAPLLAQARRAFDQDITPFVQLAFGGAEKPAATLTLPALNDYKAIITAPELRQEDRRAFVESQQSRSQDKSGGGFFSSMMSIFFGGSSDTDTRRTDSMDGYTFRTADTDGASGKKFGVDESDKPREEKRTSFVGSLVVSSRERPKITSAGGWDGKMRSAAPLPEAKFFAPLEKLDHAGVAVAAVSSKIADDVVPYAAIVPQGFDRDRRYPVDIVLAPAGTAATDVAKKIAEGALHVKDRVVLVVDGETFKGGASKVAGAQARHAKNELLAAVSDQLPLDLNRVHAPRVLDKDSASWATAIEAAPTSQARAAGGPIVFADGKFRITAPTHDYERAFPSLGWGHKGTTEIPHELQRQPPDRGTMFVPVIDSKAVGKPHRVGVYLPPGYDPASREKLPVLVMLPGKGGALNQWTSVGDITPKLDALMQGDAQKMIVVIPDATDSFWFDYDKNGSPSVGDKGKRDYEGLVMNEVIPYALEKLHGDPERLAIAGISRGGFGAMQLAARHGDKFKSVSAHSGVLALEHEGELSRMASGEIGKHFGDQDDPVWKAFNPKDLVDAGKLDKNKRVLVDIGAQDAYFLDDNIRFADALDKKGVDYQLKIWGGEGRGAQDEKKHNWDTWSPLLSSWVAFHQESFGKAGPVELNGVKDVTKDVRAERTQEMRAKEADLRARAAKLGALIPDISDAEQKLTLITYSESHRSLARPLADLARAGNELRAAVRALEREPHVHVLDARLGKVEGLVEEHAARVRRAKNAFVGAAVLDAKARPGALDALPGPAKADLAKVLDVVPELRGALEKLATVRPSVFAGKDDVTNLAFSAQLRDFVKSKHFDDKKDRAGLVEFIDRMAERRFDWRRGGYSNAVTAVMNTIFQHPGIVLQLTMASRKGDTLKYPAFYAGDPATTVKPMGDLESAFSRVSSTDSDFGGLPAAELGYERAILRIVRNALCPPPGSMPDTRAFGQRTNMPVAEGLAKLRGREMLYGYAMNLKTGDDLVKAVLSQGREGLAMADTKISVRGGPFENVHFPVFYDYDPQTRTIEMQHWSLGATRVKVDDLRFEDVGIYYEPHADLAPFLTPEKQSNWSAIKKARDIAEGRDPDEKKPTGPMGSDRGDKAQTPTSGPSTFKPWSTRSSSWSPEDD